MRVHGLQQHYAALSRQEELTALLMCSQQGFLRSQTLSVTSVKSAVYIDDVISEPRSWNEAMQEMREVIEVARSCGFRVTHSSFGLVVEQSGVLGMVWTFAASTPRLRRGTTFQQQQQYHQQQQKKPRANTSNLQPILPSSSFTFVLPTVF